jgi:hypothetical protein
MSLKVVSISSKSFSKFFFAEIAVVCIGCAVVGSALAADQQWLDRHFLPGFFVTREEYVEKELYGRAAAVAIGAAIVLLARRPMARVLAYSPASAVSVIVASILAFGAAELILRGIHLRAAEEVPARTEPLRYLDARFGWLFVPSHVGVSGNGEPIEYAFDGNGYRVPHIDEPVDFERPSIVFTGESMIVGERLPWQKTIPAQTAQLLGMQSANIAVSGFATDQAYLRLATELPRFRRPVAVVSLFTPALFDRNLDDDRPHLGPGLVWRPPENRWRLLTLARRLIRYRSTESIERGIEVTREVLRATVRLARARGAVPLIVVPEFATEEPRERELRQRILDEAGLPYVRVELDPDSRVADDGHPDVDAAEAMAVAIAERLKMALGTGSASPGLHETNDLSHRVSNDGAQLPARTDPAPRSPASIIE